MTFNSYNNTQWKNINTNTLSEPDRETIQKLYSHSYRKIGAPLNFVKNFTILKVYYPNVHILKFNEKIVAGIFYYLTKLGKKISICFSNNFSTASNHTFPKILKLLNNTNDKYYAEISHQAENIILKKNGNKLAIKNKSTIKYILQHLNERKINTSIQNKNIGNNGRYMRKIKGIEYPQKKRMYGHVENVKKLQYWNYMLNKMSAFRNRNKPLINFSNVTSKL